MSPTVAKRIGLGLALALAIGQATAQHHHQVAATPTGERAVESHDAMRAHPAAPHNPASMQHGSVFDPHAMHHDHGNVDLAQPRQPIPILSDADRAAAFPDLPGHATHDRRVFSFLQVDRLEVWDATPGTGVAWDAKSWTGNDEHRLWLRSEGEREHGGTRADVEVLYGRPLAPWWDLLAGVRQSVGDGTRSTEAAIGITGVAPQKFEVSATAYLGSGGRAGARMQVEYDVLLTNRLVLQPVLEADMHARDDSARGVGRGLRRVEAGLRLRYEFSRRIAPYLGLVHEHYYGDTATYRAEDDEPVRDTRVVAGLRLQF